MDLTLLTLSITNKSAKFEVFMTFFLPTLACERIFTELQSIESWFFLYIEAENILFPGMCEHFSVQKFYRLGLEANALNAYIIMTKNPTRNTTETLNQSIVLQNACTLTNNKAQKNL